MMMMMIKICGGERAVWKMNAKRRNKVKAATQQRSYHEHVLLFMHMYCTVHTGWLALWRVNHNNLADGKG